MSEMNEELIAPCGANCAVCSSYLARKYYIKAKGVEMPYCAGCRPDDKQCGWLKGKCQLLRQGQVKYCYECPDFPCDRLIHIDKRYQTNFRTSFLDNLKVIRTKGIKRLLAREAKKWKCPECGDVICCHNGICYNCSLDRLKERITNKKNRYRWEEG